MDTEWSDRVNRYRDELSRAETDFLQYVNANPEHAAFSSQRDLAEFSGISKPVIISFFRKLGYDDFRTFQESVESFFSTHIDSYRAAQDVQKHVSSVEELVEHAYDVDMRSLDRMRSSLPADFLSTFIRRVADAPSVYVSGVSTGFYPAHYIAQRLKRYRKPSILLSQDMSHYVDELHPLEENSVLIVFHYSDNDDYLYPLLRFARKRGAWSMLAADTIHPDYVAESHTFIHVPRGELGFKNSMANPMTFANLLLLAIEVEMGDVVRKELQELEDTRRNWGPDGQGGSYV
ncbi:MAG: RpiR family transcriptional regulator [Bacteroidetes bacterium]|nr:MAG: RpiR family transcriptional regulator [Bacteroidota bacterium]